MPAWNLTVKLSPLWHEEGITFPSRRDGLVKLIQESGWRDLTGDRGEFDLLIEELAETESAGSFDAVFKDLYDLADSDRVWIETY